MDYNKFIDAHKIRYCIHYDFQDYVRAKKISKRPLTEIATGKVVPTPNQIARKIAAKLKGDSAVKSHMNGAIQQILIADQKEFKALAGNAPVTKGDSAPCTLKALVEVRAKNYMPLAKSLGLI